MKCLGCLVGRRQKLGPGPLQEPHSPVPLSRLLVFAQLLGHMFIANGNDTELLDMIYTNNTRVGSVKYSVKRVARLVVTLLQQRLSISLLRREVCQIRLKAKRCHGVGVISSAALTEFNCGARNLMTPFFSCAIG